MTDAFNADLYDEYRTDLSDISTENLKNLGANSVTQAKAIQDELKERGRG